MVNSNELVNVKKLYNQSISSHINSLEGKIEKVCFVADCYYQNQHTYIVKYNGKYCTTIYNSFVCSYYTDDIYGVIDGFEE